MSLRALTTFLALSPLLASCAVLGPKSASATLSDPAGMVRGNATFTPEGSGTRIRVSVQGLTPGLHGMHIHVNPSCAASTDASGNTVAFGGAGGHFDPGSSNNHDAPTADNAVGHGGDIPMISVGADGTGSADFFTAKVSLSGANSVIGRSLVIHADPDDYATDPAGNTGPRERCGVINAS